MQQGTPTMAATSTLPFSSIRAIVEEHQRSLPIPLHSPVLSILPLGQLSASVFHGQPSKPPFTLPSYHNSAPSQAPSMYQPPYPPSQTLLAAHAAPFIGSAITVIICDTGGAAAPSWRLCKITVRAGTSWSRAQQQASCITPLWSPPPPILA